MWNPLKKTDPVKATWVQASVDDLRIHSPDAAVIMRYELQLLFVYDQMMGGLYESDKLGPESMFGATAYTQAEYILWKKKLGIRSEAVAVEAKKNHRWSMDVPSRIQGEIYAVRPSKLIELDKYKDNMVSFRRTRVRLIIPYREIVWLKERDAVAYLSDSDPNSIATTEEKVCEVRAWMYVGTDYWNELFDGGFLFAPVRLYTPRSTVSQLGISQYSRFSQLEYE